MSQSATLYRITTGDFHKFIQEPTTSNLLKLAKQYVCFQSNHEGLLFVLTKIAKPASAEILKEILYPSNSLKVDFGEYEDFVYYLDTGKVSLVYLSIEDISEHDIERNFDLEQMNELRIYPWHWYEEDSIFLKQSFINLKNLFSTANKEKDYIMVFVG
ncbi:MAG TPA: DUF1877 family protein [Segetibacter sp.]